MPSCQSEQEHAIHSSSPTIAFTTAARKQQLQAANALFTNHSAVVPVVAVAAPVIAMILKDMLVSLLLGPGECEVCSVTSWFLHLLLTNSHLMINGICHELLRHTVQQAT